MEYELFLHRYKMLSIHTWLPISKEFPQKIKILPYVPISVKGFLKVSKGRFLE
jgi:hypothetical protein